MVTLTLLSQRHLYAGRGHHHHLHHLLLPPFDFVLLRTLGLTACRAELAAGCQVGTDSYVDGRNLEFGAKEVHTPPPAKHYVFASEVTDCLSVDEFDSELTDCLSVDKFASELTDCLSVDEFASELTNCLSVGQNRLVHFWREEIGNRNRLVTRRRSRRRSRRRQPSSTMAAAAAALRRPSEATTPKISPLKISLYKCY